MTFLRTVYELLRDTVTEFTRDKCPTLGAALAFYVMLSLAPLLLVVIGIAGLVYGDDAPARAQVVSQFRDLVGADGATLVETMLAASRSKSGGVLSTVIGLVVLVIGATGVFAQLQEALNAVWNVPERKTAGLGLWVMLRDRLLSFSVVLGLAFLLLVSLVLGAVLAGVQNWLKAHLGDGAAWGIGTLNFALSLALSAVLFALIYKLLPDARVGWRSVWVGAVATALLFNLGKYLIGLYLGQAAVGSSFGAAGSLAVLLVWVYYSTQLLLVGAEFTQVYATRFGRGLRYAGQPAPTSGGATPAAA
jgi:membrane protein